MYGQARQVNAFPDMHIDVLDCFGAGDKIAVRWSATMHHHGNGLGIEPTGAEVKITGMGMARIVNGKVAETWDNWDKLAMFQQIEAASKAKSATHSRHQRSVIRDQRRRLQQFRQRICRAPCGKNQIRRA